MAGVNLHVVNPGGTVFEKVTRRAASRRLDDLNGKKIGVLNNTHPGGEILWPYVEEALKERLPSIELRSWKVPHRYPPERKETPIKELAEYSDAVIASMAG
jgi:hypothetical protein